jgi:hypothetical protein
MNNKLAEFAINWLHKVYTFENRQNQIINLNFTKNQKNKKPNSRAR